MSFRALVVVQSIAGPVFVSIVLVSVLTEEVGDFFRRNQKPEEHLPSDGK